MKLWLLIGMIALAAGVTEAQPAERSLSPSRQFIIYGGETPLRGAISDAAEEVKRTWLSILRERDNWKTPIIVYLQFAQANLPELPRSKLNVSQTGAGLKLQVDLLITADLNPNRIRRELLRAIVLERMYRKQPDLPAGSPYVTPPDWLLEAVLAATPGWRNSLGGLTDPTMPLEQFLQQKPELLDSAARRLYQASALSLLEVVADGNGRLNRYVDSLPGASNDPLADLVTQFGTFSAQDIERLWRGAFAAVTAGPQQFMSFSETDNALTTLLKTKTGRSLGALARQRKLSAAEREEVHQTAEQLLLLSGSAHPLARPIVRQYEEVVARLAAGKTHGAAERLARIDSTRRHLVGRMNDIDDYLNWFEATQAHTRSGMFTDYLRAAAKDDASGPHRRDPMSVYLDALQQQIGD